MDNVLEAKECYILMKKEYRISRNIRAEWYLNRINSCVTISRKTNVNDFHGELDVISVLPLNPPSEWDSDTAHEYKYLITERTQLHFLSQKYRLVFCLDLSPSLSVPNMEKGKIVYEEVFPTLERCLEGIVRPFVVPGSQLLFFPKIYVTIIAHTPFFTSQPQQVIVQGWLLMSEKENMGLFLKNVQVGLIELQNQLAKLMKEFYSQERAIEASQDSKGVSNGPTKEGDCLSFPDGEPMVSPDIGFVNMLRYGIVALQLLPQNSMAGIIVITDGIISLPDATMFDALLVQLRNLTISCSFLQVGTVYQPHAGLGYVSFNDLMLFLANATSGVYLPSLPVINKNYENEINAYHKAFLTWGFQKTSEQENRMPYSAEDNSYIKWAMFSAETSMRIRKQERKAPLRATLSAVLSCRLREGYTIKDVKITSDHIELILVLTWKYSISIEYHIHSVWPPTQSEVQTEVWIEASYEFLSDVSSNESNCGVRSYYRQQMVGKYLSTLQDLRETDYLLANIQSFPFNVSYYTIPECVQKGMPVFYVNSQSPRPQPSSDFQVQNPQFANFWLPICMLNINKWQKWMHVHRIGIILKHETPLPKNLHVTNSSGRFGTVHSRHSELTLTSFLAKWTNFTLIENNSYIKYLYNNEEDQVPSSFFIVRIKPNRPPCLAIHLAFLGGTSCEIRSKIVGELQRNIQQLTVRIRERSRERRGIDNLQKTKSEEHEQNVNSVLCCSITHKPIEKILIWYDRIPANLFSSQVLSNQNYSIHSSTRFGTLNKSNSDQALLRRYLHHRRCIWGLQSSANPTLPSNAIMKILDTLTRMRLQEGFKFAYSRNGIITMVKEFEMKLDLHSTYGGTGRHIDAIDMSSFCTVQYIMFPPHFANSKDNLEEEGDEMESVEADGESQLITECWVEPQNGMVQDPSGTSHGLLYKQLAASFFPLDQECIWGLITFECLSQFGQEENAQSFASSNLLLDEGSPQDTPHKNTSAPSKSIQMIPYHFHLTPLLPRCQRAEVLLSTLFQDLYGFLANSSATNKEFDRANHVLYSLILDHLNQLHNGKQFHLSSYDNSNLPQVLAQWTRDPRVGSSPLANTDVEKCSDVPKWRCFLKYISQKHFIITLVPSSYRDLKLLLVNRTNIIEGQTKAVQLVEKFEDFRIFEAMKEEDITTGKMEESYLTTPSDRTALSSSTNTQKDNVASPCYQHQHSFTSSSSCRSSSIPQDPPDKSPLIQKQLFPPAYESTPKPAHNVDESRKMRYRSGPPLSSHAPYPVEPLVLDTPDFLGPRSRSRAFSLHSNTGGGGPKIISRQNKEKEATPPTPPIRERTSSWATASSEKNRKRNISMPSKCHKEMTPLPGIYNKSLSAEAVKGSECPTPVFQDENNPLNSSTTDSSQHIPTHTPLYGSVTLPVYCFDCRFSSIVSQLVNKEYDGLEIGKDIYMDSTFKPDMYKSEDPDAGSGRGESDSRTPNASRDGADKYPSPEPLSEESDTLAPDSKWLKNFTESIEKCQRKSFVMGVFEALANDLFVHTIDVQAALDQCQEVFLETDITNYLEIICGHLKDFRMKVYMKQKKNVDSLYALGTEKLTKLQAEYDRETSSTAPPFPLSLLNEYQACKDLVSIHYGIDQKFSNILQSQFKPVPNLPNYYYYSPKSMTYSQAENNKYKYWSLKRKTKKVSEGEESFNDGDQLEEDEEESCRPADDDEAVAFLDDEDREKSIEFRSEDGSYGGHHSFMRQFSQMSRLTQLSEFEDCPRVTEENESDMASYPPLFLHLTCTIRRQNHTVGTASITTLPTCLGDVAECFSQPEIDLSEVSVTLDVLVITLLGGADICSGEVEAERRRGRRTISGCSTASSVFRLSESTGNSNSESEEAYIEEEDLLNHLPDDQHKAVLITFEKIKWLIQDEIVSSLLLCYPITEEMLQLVATHVSESNPAPNCHVETVLLKFVFGVEQSLDKFMQEFKNLRISGYQLRKVGSFYFLAVPPDAARKRRLFSLVPPLMLKHNTPRWGETRHEGPPVDSEGTPPSGPEEELEKKQKVTFDAGSSSETRGKTEETSTEVRKGEKWIRRRERKERRDSEKRATLESSETDEEPSVTMFLLRETSAHSTDLPDKPEQESLSLPTYTKDQIDKDGEDEMKDTPQVEKGQSHNTPGIEGNILDHAEGGTTEKAGLDFETNDPTEGTQNEDMKSSVIVKPLEMLAPRPLELIRCGSINLPHTQGTKTTEVIRKSASTDDFSPSIQGPETPKGTPASIGSGVCWSDVMVSRQSSMDGIKHPNEMSKIRHSSGGEILKSRHDSGTGSVMGPFSDVSSLLGSGQTTEDGCEGDISDSDDCADWMQDFDIAMPPDFWIIIKMEANVVQTYFHCRMESEVERWMNVHKDVVRSLREQVKLVNQRLLLEDLNKCRKCKILLEPETSEDIWKLEDSKDLAENNEYLEASMKFKLGAFACRQVWSKNFELHPRLKLSGKGANKGIQTLKKTLNPFMVNNRKNMFVYEDSSGQGTNVFYLRLHEQQSLSVSGTLMDVRRDDSSSRSSSMSSLVKRGIREEETPAQADGRRSFIEKDVIVEGVPSTSAQRKSQDFIVLTVHGIAEPGVAIKENLVQMLQKRLDDAVLDAICLMPWDNPHHKLTAEDVHFIQPPYQPPSRVIRFSVNPYALPYIPAVCFYLRQNMLSCGFTSPKYTTDSRPEHHFQDFSATDQDPTTEPHIYLFVCSQKSGTKGVACLAFSVVDVAGNALQSKGLQRPNPKSHEELVTDQDFEAMTYTAQQTTDNENGAVAMFQFKVWEAGRLDFNEIGKCLEEAIRHALWDLSTECRFLVAPVTPSCVTSGGSSHPTTPVKGVSKGPFGSPRNSVPTCERSGSPLSYSQMESMPKVIPRSPSKARHSIDFGKEQQMVLKSEGKMKSEESLPDENEQVTPDAPPEPLHKVFSHLMPKWFELGVQMAVPAVKKHVVVCSTRSALQVFMIEVQRWLQFHLVDNSTKFFRQKLDNTYTKFDVFKVGQLLKTRKENGKNGCQLIITNRNERQWWTILFEKDILEMNSHVIKANKNMKFDSLFVANQTTQEVVSESLGANGTKVSSPNSASVPTFSDSAPPTQSHFKFGDPNVGSNSGFIHRQMFFLATLDDNEFTVYSYNWMKDLNEMLHAYLNRLCHWTTARSSLLSSLALQKLGLFHNQPFIRKEPDLKEDSYKKENEKKDEANPFIQNLHYIEGLIRSPSHGRDAQGPTDRSGRRNQSQPSLQNLSEVLRDSAPPKPLHKQHQPQKKDLLQRHGMQMAEVTRMNLHKEKERRILQSTLQSQTGSTSGFNDVTMALFKKHARIAHFCFTPLLFLPKWRSEVAAVRDHSFPDIISVWPESNSQGKGTESRSRHESGASAKYTGNTSTSTQLELRRSSSVGLPPSTGIVASPNHTRKRHPTLLREEKWHEALCLSYLKEFIQYLHCLSFDMLSVTHAQQNLGSRGDRSRLDGGGTYKEESLGPKTSDQDVSLATYLVRRYFGGTVLLQINFAEPYFSAISINFIDEVELIRLHLHMHSFTYDYHLRAVCVYVSGRQLLFARGYHLSSFLSDFIKYYTKSPNCARNLIHSGEVRIEDIGTPGELLYNYLLEREKEYHMRVLRMTPVAGDMSSDRYTEFVLVHTKAYRFPFDEEIEQRDGDDYDVTLLVSHDTERALNDTDYNTLNLKFYVILTCRRDMYPNRNPESKSGRFRTVSTANTMDQLKMSANIATSSTSSSTSSNYNTSSGRNHGPSTNSKGYSSITRTNYTTPNTTPAKPSHLSIRNESVNYLGYYSEYEIYMQQILEQQVIEARERILQIFDTAKIHCRRDTLWQKLMWGLKEEEKGKSTREQNSHTINFSEFTELLTLVNVRSISKLDPQLLALVSKPIHWYQSLTRLLPLKYQDTSRYGIRVLLSLDGNVQHVVVYTVTCPDACIMISQNVQTQRADICCVRKQSDCDILNPKVRDFLQDFVNCCCFHLWSGLI